MPTYAIPPEGCSSYLTAGKRYEVLREETIGGFYITDNDGDEIYCLWDSCGHLDGGDWTREEVTQDDTETLGVMADFIGKIVAVLAVFAVIGAALGVFAGTMVLVFRLLT